MVCALNGEVLKSIVAFSNKIMIQKFKGSSLCSFLT